MPIYLFLLVSIFCVVMSIFGRLFASAKTRLSACIFFLLLQKSRSASPHVEGCCCTIPAIKRIPLLSCAAVEPCTSVYTAQRQVFLTKNLLLHGTTAVLGGVEQCTSVYTVQRRDLCIAQISLPRGTTALHGKFKN